MECYSYIILLLRSRPFNTKKGMIVIAHSFHVDGVEVSDQKREIYSDFLTSVGTNFRMVPLIQ